MVVVSSPDFARAVSTAACLTTRSPARKPLSKSRMFICSSACQLLAGTKNCDGNVLCGWKIPSNIGR